MIGASKNSAPAQGPHALASDVEHIPVTVYSSSAAASTAAAQEIAALIRMKEARGEKAVLGLATGSTPTGIYDELLRLHREEGLSFKNVITFNLDEYWPMNPTDLQSYRRFMNEHLFDHIDIHPQNAHVPDGTVPLEKVGQFCLEYERKIKAAGGLDFQILGVGRTGHIGFNEPGSPRDSRTRLITLDRVTRMDAASDFFGEWNVPRKAITMGVETILSAKTVLLLAFGEHKANPIRRAVEGEISATVAASYLQQHPSARIVLDTAAASELTRFKTPWLLGPLDQFAMEWDAKTTRTAATWLALTVKKPLLKLTDEDYNEHGLQELLSHRGSAYDINIEVFKSLQNTITGWPGGKPANPTRHVPNPTYYNPWTSQPRETPGPAPTDDGSGGRNIFAKRVVVFSPHPDDDVISMGGTFIRLCEQGH
ncbi:MAG TPA: glucosamine-6-phosphate deaminase, partial [Humisphaera sp.]|nr:glucosamine-6-phosphate deaminase [Humisphaera sp.]